MHVSGDVRRAVARELAAYAVELAAERAVQVGDGFTTHAAANDLMLKRPEAFLIGVLFTQGVPAERAWAGPWLLSERLGHLDLARLAGEPDRVAEAVARRPALHRFVHTLPRWISSAAARVLAEYDGDARRIWPDGAHVLEVTERLLAFDGIGEKKAAMAVDLLTRALNVPMTGIECGTVAYDVHVRRVFLRTGLIAHDTLAAVNEAAAAACPEAPASLDLPTWLVGRQWCRPRRPECDLCRLGSVCPRLTHLRVEGVGARRPSAE